MNSYRRNQKTLFLLILFGLVAVFSVVFGAAVHLVAADSGGFPTPTPSATATLIILPSATPTVTPIVLPTQESSALLLPSDEKSLEAEVAESESVEGGASSKSLAQVEPVQPPQQEQSGTGLGNLFLIGLFIGVIILGLGALVFWMLRRSRVIP